jgi:hypothetical protein
MSDVTASPEPSSVTKDRFELVLLPLAFGFTQIVALWSFGGGDIDLFWSRQIVVALAVVATAVGLIAYDGRLAEFRPDAKAVRAGLLGGALGALPIIILTLVLPRMTLAPGSLLASLAQTLRDFRPHGISDLLIATLLLAPAHAALSLGVFGPRWGYGGVAFLDSLTLGFGFQRFWPFALGYVLIHGWGHFVRERHGLSAAVIAGSLWMLLVLTGLLVFL